MFHVILVVAVIGTHRNDILENDGDFLKSFAHLANGPWKKKFEL